jgi:hypothetical protein
MAHEDTVPSIQRSIRAAIKKGSEEEMYVAAYTCSLQQESQQKTPRTSLLYFFPTARSSSSVNPDRTQHSTPNKIK